MLENRLVFCLASLLIVCTAAQSVEGQALPLTSVLSPQQSITIPRHVPSVGVKKFFNSFTSYQFPNPFPPGQDPLSRLEFPIDQWFLGLQHEYLAQSWSFLPQLWVNVSRDSGLKMQDSDWADDLLPLQKTIFSESGCRLNRGLIFDASVTTSPPDWARFVRGVIGWRYQHFFFTTHDGYQAEFNHGAGDLPGDGIEFQQTFYQFYFGANVRGGLNLALVRDFLPQILVGLQVDYALVNAKNEDLHLLRAGNRITTENTIGHCWHVFAGMSLICGDSFNARFEADFKRLITHGDHKLSNLALNIAFSGSRVWSDQLSCTFLGEFIF